MGMPNLILMFFLCHSGNALCNSDGNAEECAQSIDSTTLLQMRVQASEDLASDVDQSSELYDEASLSREKPTISTEEMQRIHFPTPDPKQRCKGSPANGWNNFGKGVTESECKQKCLDAPSCQFVGFNMDRGRCTEFAECVQPQKANSRWSLWKKADSTATTLAPSEPSTEVPQPTTEPPEPSTPAPEASTAAPEPTTPAPEPTTMAPELTTLAPEPTTLAPEPSTSAPGSPEEPSTAAPTPNPFGEPGSCSATDVQMERIDDPNIPDDYCVGKPVSGMLNIGEDVRVKEEECKQACLENTFCKFVAHSNNGFCREFAECDKMRAYKKFTWSVWKKPPPAGTKMTDSQMEIIQYKPYKCDGSHGWGSYSRGWMVAEDCANACLRDPSCKFVGMYWYTWGEKRGVCTQYDSCAENTEPGAKVHGSAAPFWKKTPAPSPVPLPSPPCVLKGDQRRWDILPGEVKLANTTTAPDGISAGYTDTNCTICAKDNRKYHWANQCWMSYNMAKCKKGVGASQYIPVEKHGDPKGVEWCATRSSGDAKKDLCDEVKSKYDEVEKLEARIYHMYTKRATLVYRYEHTSMFGPIYQQHVWKLIRRCNTQCGLIDEQLSKALSELAALNDKVVA